MTPTVMSGAYPTQPYGPDAEPFRANGRTWGVGGIPALARIDGLTKVEAAIVVAAIRNDLAHDCTERIEAAERGLRRIITGGDVWSKQMAESSLMAAQAHGLHSPIDNRAIWSVVAAMIAERLTFTPEQAPRFGWHVVQDLIDECRKRAEVSA